MASARVPDLGVVEAREAAELVVQHRQHLERVHRLRLLRTRRREQPVQHLERAGDVALSIAFVRRYGGTPPASPR